MVAFRKSPVLLAVAFAVASWSSTPARAALPAELATGLERELPSLIQFYQTLHREPELSFQETKTSARLAAELKAAGFEVTDHIGRLGVVGVKRNGAGPTLLIRTDMDALPVKEETGLPYASQASGTNETGEITRVMHACGHDIHMTVLTGTARLLGRTTNLWQGTLVLLCQPAEERGGGAREILKDGLYRRFPRPDAAFALHCNAGMAAGKVGTVSGFAFANVNSVDITIRGVGGHGAYPHLTKDPVVTAAQTILALQTIVSRETDPLESAVVTVGSIHGGTKHNVIPDDVKLQVTLRSYTDEVRKLTVQSLERIVRHTAMASGIPEDRLPTVKVKDEFTPAVYNDPDLTRRVRGVFEGLFSGDRIETVRPVMAGEDFSEYGRTSEKVPLCLFWLGVADPAKVATASAAGGEPLPSLHSNRFAPVPEPSIATGIKAMTSAALEFLRRP